MKSGNVSWTLFGVVAAFTILIFYFRCHPEGKEVFNRHPQQLVFTRHAQCRMNCRHISRRDVDDIMKGGIINLAKSNKAGSPCPVYALQGLTRDNESVRVIFAQCGSETRVITCYNLKEDFECHCPGDEKKNE